MKTAVTVWNNRISPVFDVASVFYIYEIHNGNTAMELELDLSSFTAFEKVVELARINTGTIVCGAISRPVNCFAKSYGMDIFSFISGDLSSVLKALEENRITDEVLKMPGCGKRGSLCRRGNSCSEGEKI